MNAWLGVAAVFVLTFGTGYFVAQEFAYVSADRLELSRQAKAGDKAAASAIAVMQRLSFMLSAAQIGITVTGLLVGLIARPAFSPLLEPLLVDLGLPDSAATGVAITVGFIVATVLQMVLGELFPKNLALAKAESLAKALAPSTHLYLALSGWLVRIFDNTARWILRMVGIEPVEELHHGATVQELGYIIGESRAGGELSDELSGVLRRALKFSERTAGRAMVPRPAVVTVRAATTAAELVTVIGEHGHSHYAVRAATTDEVLGVVGVRELMKLPYERLGQVTAADLARWPLLIPDSLPLPAVVEQMRDSGDEFACVVDEYGGLAGIITLEDIAEELVGDIADENDEDSASAVRAGEWWQLDAGLRIDEAASHTGLPLPESDDYDTVAGLIVATLGRFAEPGDQLVIGDDVEIEVDTLSRHVPSQVRARRHPAASAPGTNGSAL